MGEKKIVLDTNILISAFGWKGKPNEIFSKVINGEFKLIMSRKQLEEVEMVIEYPKFSFTNDQKNRFLMVLLNTVNIVETNGELRLIKEDPKDDVILESAIENDVDFLISGDEHLLKIKKYSNTKIVTAAEFLELIKN